MRKPAADKHKSSCEASRKSREGERGGYFPRANTCSHTHTQCSGSQGATGADDSCQTQRLWGLRECDNTLSHSRRTLPPPTSVTNFHLDTPQLESSVSLPKQEGEDGRNKNNQGSIFSKSSALSSRLCVCVPSTLSSLKITKQNAASGHANSTRAGKRKEEAQPGRRRTRTQRLRAVMPPS